MEISKIKFALFVNFIFSLIIWVYFTIKLKRENLQYIRQTICINIAVHKSYLIKYLYFTVLRTYKMCFIVLLHST